MLIDLVRKDWDPLIHWAGVIPHEGGHFLFAPFGEFLAILGGTLTEVGLPLLFAVGFAVQHNRSMVGLMLLWTAITLESVSRYAADAQDRSLPLMTQFFVEGTAESHDWGNLLTMLGLLEYTPQVAGFIWFLGMLCWLTGMFIGIHAALWGPLDARSARWIVSSPRR